MHMCDNDSLDPRDLPNLLDMPADTFNRYAITINCNHIEKSDCITPALRSVYSKLVARLRRHANTVKEYYELGPQKRVHVHLFIETPKDQSYVVKQLICKGYNSKVDDVYDEAGWLKYIMKDQRGASA